MIPTIDPQVKYVGTSYLRSLNTETMKELSGAVVVQDAEAEPLVVIVPFPVYMALQSQVLHREIWDNAVGNAIANPDMSHSTKGYAGPKKPSKRERVVQERAASDVTAQAVGRPDVDYSDVDSTPTTHIASLDAVSPPQSSGRGKVTMENWRANRKPLTKPKDRK